MQPPQNRHDTAAPQSAAPMGRVASGGAHPAQHALPAPVHRLMPRPRLRQILPTALVLAGVAVLVIPARGAISEAVALLILLSAVLVNAAAFGFWPGQISALVGLVIFNFFFVEPHFTLVAAQPQDMVVLISFLGAAALTGVLAGRLREEVDAARDRADVLEVLSRASADLAHAPDAPAVLGASMTHLAALAGRPVLILTRGEEGLGVLARTEGAMPSAADLQAAEAALLRGRVELATAEGWTGSHLTFRPLPQGRAADYVLGHPPIGARGPDFGHREAAITSVMAQAEAALARLTLTRQAEEEREAHAAQTLRAALLASLSHDLRTPLATILGSVTTLRDLRAGLSPEAQDDLLDAASEEAGRLARYVEKLLQMTRLVSGAQAALSAVDPGEAAQAAALRAARAFPNAEITTDLPDLPLVQAEAGLVEQVIFSLIENAVRYAPGPVQVSGRLCPEGLRLEVVDQGRGLPEAVRLWLDSPELTRQLPASQTMAVGGGVGAGIGSGLGLPICKGIARLLGGRLIARPDGAADPTGAALALILPLRTPEAAA